MNYPFIFGAQYYRAPTPDESCWERDLKRMSDLGCNAVKFWVQWRYVHRSENEFIFDDIDRLMDLAYKYGLKVTLNVIFDVAPIWLFEKYPDGMITTREGEKVYARTHPARQLGGMPGCCYTHKGCLKERDRFLTETVRHFKDHPAMQMWDVWNEPEQNCILRNANSKTISCYCDSCTEKFKKEWLPIKYGCIENLNKVWGRVYKSFDEVEIPYTATTFVDFIDYRQFMLDNMTEEADFRIRRVKEEDGKHITYLHVVPNTLRCWNPVSCVDDFDIAKNCDVFAGTMGKGISANLVSSAGKGKIIYNVESHVHYGSIRNHENILNEKDFFKDLISQIGNNVKGFLFWQFRAETLGSEAPAWGMIKPNGKDMPITKSLKTFTDKIMPIADRIMKASTPAPEIAIWKSTANELFQFCSCEWDWVDKAASSYESYANLFYDNSINYKFINSEMLINGEIDDIKLLVMPACYGLTKEEAQGLKRWVNNGGILICEAHLGGYDLTSNRHSATMPGFGLCDVFGIEEELTTSSIHLNVSNAKANITDMSDDVKKAMEMYGNNGGQYYPILMNDGSVLSGSDRFAMLSDGEVLGQFGDMPCIVKKRVGEGTVIYCGTDLGQGAKNDFEPFKNFILGLLDEFGLKPVMSFKSENYNCVHADLLTSDTGDIIVLNNNTSAVQQFTINHKGRYKGVFTDFEMNLDETNTFEIPDSFIDVLIEQSND